MLEKLAEHDAHSKALTVLAGTLELFAMRGIAERWPETGVPVPIVALCPVNTRLDSTPASVFLFYLARTREATECQGPPST